MTEKQIIAEAKLIAGFLGIKRFADCPDDYHKRWDKLMSVVEAIGWIDGNEFEIIHKTGCTDSFPYVSIKTWNYTTNNPHIISIINIPGYFDGDGAMPLIEAVYKTIIVFIKFYNKHGIQNKGKKQTRQPYRAA